MQVNEFRKELNLRDLGGYLTKDGRTVKKGLLFRSAELAFYTEEELHALQEYQIRTIIDFRSDKGVKLRPDPAMQGAVYMHKAAAFQNLFDDLNSPQSVANLLFDADQKGNVFDRLISTYSASLAFSNEAFALLFEAMQDEKGAILFHCANGKDRTGVAAMLLHLLLGVSAEDAKKDYLLSNDYRQAFIDEMMEEHSFLRHSNHMSTIMEMISGVIPESADMMLTEIPERYGSYENFFVQEYGISEEEIAELRNFYCE